MRVLNTNYCAGESRLYRRRMMSKRFTLDTLQEFWAKRPKGARLQVKRDIAFGAWAWDSIMGITPRINNNIDDWRWEPQSEPVDLSSLIGSDVLFEFGEGIERYGFLKDVIEENCYLDQNDSLWTQCKPVMNKWMAVGECLVLPAGLEYECKATRVIGIKLVKIDGLKENYHWTGDENKCYWTGGK